MGLLDKLLGRTKQAAGDVTGDPSLRREGMHQEMEGAAEDRAVACSIQQGLASGANEFFEFGRFEGAIGHFHRNLHAALAG